MGPVKSSSKSCHEFRSRLESAAGVSPGPAQFSEVLADLPGELREHVANCAQCREAAETTLASRALLAGYPSSADLGGPWFPARVMFAISARRAELSRVPETWRLLPKLAARLTWAASVALLLASGWLYQRPQPIAEPTSASAVLTDITGEPVHENALPASNDELLISLAEPQK